MANKIGLCFSPTSLDDLKQIVQLAKKRNRCINVTAKKKTDRNEKSTQFVVNMEHFNRIVEINLTKCCVVVEASAQISAIKTYLDKVGLALCMPGLPHNKTVASAFSSGCHSSNMNQAIMSSFVPSIDILTSDNKIVTLTPEDKEFRAIACGLGACGIILLITLKCEPIYQLRTTRFGCSFDKLLGNLPFNLKRYSNLSISWWPHTNNATVSNTEKIYGAPRTYKGKPHKVHFSMNLKHWTVDVISIHLINVLYWFCLIFPFLIPLVHYLSFWLIFIWQEVKYFSPNDEISQTKSLNCSQKTCKWFIPIQKTVLALKLIEKWCDLNCHYLNYPMHIQFIKKDSVYLSPANEVDVCCIHMSISQPYGFYFPYEKAFSEFGELMKNIGGRPQLYQNLNAKNEDLDTMFPHYEEWFTLRNKLDPHNLFVNYLE